MSRPKQDPYHGLSVVAHTHRLGFARLVSLSGMPCRHSGLSEEEFGTLHNSVKRGDLVGVKGFPGKSKRGELSVFPQSLLVLAPCLHMVPKHRLDNQVSSLEAVLPWYFLLMLSVHLENRMFQRSCVSVDELNHVLLVKVCCREFGS